MAIVGAKHRFSVDNLNAMKKLMDNEYAKNQCRPGDPDFVYDKRVSFDGPKVKNHWDEDESVTATLSDQHAAAEPISYEPTQISSQSEDLRESRIDAIDVVEETTVDQSNHDLAFLQSEDDAGSTLKALAHPINESDADEYSDDFGGGDTESENEL